MTKQILMTLASFAVTIAGFVTIWQGEVHHAEELSAELSHAEEKIEQALDQAKADKKAADAAIATALGERDNALRAANAAVVELNESRIALADATMAEFKLLELAAERASTAGMLKNDQTEAALGSADDAASAALAAAMASVQEEIQQRAALISDRENNVALSQADITATDGSAAAAQAAGN